MIGWQLSVRRPQAQASAAGACCEREGARLAGPTLAFTALSLCTPLAAQVQDIYRINGARFASHVEYPEHGVEIAPGKELVLGDLSGPGKVTYFYFTDDGYFYDRPQYAGLILKVYWDGAREPSIQVPLWNFFGAFGKRTLDYQSLVMQINHFCYMSYLPMPFSTRARFVLVNDGDRPYTQSVAWGIDYEKNLAFEHEASRLHAAWHRSKPALSADSVHPMLEITGKGQYIGNFLQVNTDYPGWWGEGDTIFEVDGEKITHTPGTEDEYGSTWRFEHTFSYPYSGYIQMDEGKNRMYRWYLVNPVRFKKSLRVDIQDQRVVNGKQVPSRDKSDDFTSVVFWYQEGAHPAPAIPPYAERASENAERQ